ncbi:HD domain-containing protein [Streptomyces sp. NPDC048644]|uniref:HD domain-containing protein n=1 Tax=Streptomyces sp. NPDC048644 TaxID=3365582 RepID=UPI00370FB468
MRRCGLGPYGFQIDDSNLIESEEENPTTGDGSRQFGLQSTRVSDIPHIGRRYLDAASNETVTADQVSAAHPAVQAGAKRIVQEYEHGDSLEVVCAHDADKLECLIQAVEYRE